MYGDMGLRGLCRATVAVALLTTGIRAGLVLLRNGCRKQGDLPMGDVVDNATLPNNHPWTCASYCKRQNVIATHLALQDEECLCFHTSSDFSKGVDRPPQCTNTCPGHHGHVCGGTGIKYSIYRFDNLTNVSSMQCVAVECFATGEANKTGRSCSDYLHGYCINRQSDHQCDNVTTWSNYDCPSNGQMDYEFGRYQFCKSTLNKPCQLSETYWIGGIGPWAPPKTCQPVSTLANGEWTNGSYLGVGDDTEKITYTCNSGYTLNGIQRRECMADGSWTGTPPTCIPDPTMTGLPKPPSTTHNPPDSTSSTTHATSRTTNTKGLSTGAIAGIGVGCVVAAAGVGFAILKFTGKRPHSNHLNAESNANAKWDPSKSNQTAPDTDRTPIFAIPMFGRSNSRSESDDESMNNEAGLHF